MKDLTKGKPSTLILSFALPVFLGNLLQLTYSLADTRIVGSFLKEDALAAVGATSPLSGLIIGFPLMTRPSAWRGGSKRRFSRRRIRHRRCCPRAIATLSTGRYRA